MAVAPGRPRARRGGTTRITGAFMSYWVYQHLGNLAPPELAEEPLYQPSLGGRRGRRRAAWRRSPRRPIASRRRPGGRAAATSAARGCWWSTPAPPACSTTASATWWTTTSGQWIVEHSREEVDHLIIVSSLPVFMSPGVHYLEAWNEAVCAGAWGAAGGAGSASACAGALDLEHWPAFQRLVRPDGGRCCATWRAAPRQRRPASVTLVGGDVHNAYVAEVSLGRVDRAQSRVHQVVCSPFRNPLGPVRAAGRQRSPKSRGRRGAACAGWRGWPACGSRRCGGGTAPGRPSTTRSA